MKRYIGWGLGVVLIGGVVWLGFWVTNPKPVTESVSDAKIHPAQLAERYRQGDLLLQDGIMDYRHSQKTAADEQALLDVWHQAQRILEGAPGGARKVVTNDKADGAGGAVR
jgi:hypothetical protein